MITLLPITDKQTISIIPRLDDFYTEYEFEYRVIADGGTYVDVSCIDDVISLTEGLEITITRDGRGDSEVITDIRVFRNGNFLDFIFACSILSEGDSYFMEMTKYGNLIYRDKIYATSQTNYTVKHKQSQNIYKEYDEVDDNTYII